MKVDKTTKSMPVKQELPKKPIKKRNRVITEEYGCGQPDCKMAGPYCSSNNCPYN